MSKDELITQHCCRCKMAFGMTKEFHEQRLSDQKALYCPDGHKQYYPKDKIIGNH